MLTANLEKLNLDCFLISIYLQNCHCIVHKHRKQANFIKSKKRPFKLWLPWQQYQLHHHKSYNERFQQDFRKSHEISASLILQCIPKLFTKIYSPPLTPPPPSSPGWIGLKAHTTLKTVKMLQQTTFELRFSSHEQ